MFILNYRVPRGQRPPEEVGGSSSGSGAPFPAISHQEQMAGLPLTSAQQCHQSRALPRPGRDVAYLKELINGKQEEKRSQQLDWGLEAKTPLS